MSNVNVQYGVQVYDGVNSNILSASRTGLLSFLNYTVLFSERIIVPPNTTAMLITLPTLVAKVVLVENLGSVSVSLQVNSNAGTLFPIAPVGGTSIGSFQWTPSAGGVSSLYLTNSDPSNGGNVNILVAG